MCGYFIEIALPSPNVETAKRHWERIGFVGMDEPDAVLPHVSCTSDTVDVGLYDPAHLREPTLLFEVANFSESVARLREAGFTPNLNLPAPLRHADAAMLTAPEGTFILLGDPGAGRRRPLSSSPCDGVREGARRRRRCWSLRRTPCRRRPPAR